MTTHITPAQLMDTVDRKKNGVREAGYPHVITKDYTKSEARGEDLPNFFARKKRGELLPFTNWIQTSAEHNVVPSTWTTKYGANQWITSSNVWYDVNKHHSGILGGISDNADTAYVMSELQRAANSIYGKGYDALTGLAEAHKIKSMFVKTARKLDVVINKTRKLRREEILDAWTEGRYGYRTLAYDIRDLNEAISSFDENRRIYTERSGYSTNAIDTTTTILDWQSQVVTISIQDATSHSIRGSVAAKLKPARFTVNPLVTGWELIPYSFIIDWALSVGDALGTAMLLATSEGTTAAIGVKSITNRSLSSSSTPKSGWTISGSYSYTGVFEQVTRTPAKLSVKPTLRGRIIRPDQVLDLTAIFNRERRRITK